MKKILPIVILIIILASALALFKVRSKEASNSPKLESKTQVQTPVVKIAGSELSLTSDGQAVTGASDKLPTLFLPSNLIVTTEQKITDKATLQALEVASLLAKSDFLATNIRFLDSGDIAVYDARQTVAIFHKDGSPKEQVDSLQQVIALAKIDDDKIAKIDLRFEKPVITFK